LITENKSDYRKLTTFGEVINIFRQQPEWILPLIVVWCVNIIVVLYSPGFKTVCVFSVSLVYACAALLDMIKHYTSQEKVNFVRTLWEILISRVISLLLLSFVWIAFGTILIIFDLLFNQLFSNAKRNIEDLDLTLKVIAVNIVNGQSSIRALPSRFRYRAIRQILFMILPVLIWERTGLISGYQRSKFIVRKQITEIIINPDFISKAGFFVFVPLLGLLFLKIKGIYEISTSFGLFATIYVVLASSFMLYVNYLQVTDSYIQFLERNSEEE